MSSNLVRISDFALFLQLTDEDAGRTMRYDIVHFAADFGLNAIPRATCLMTLGRQANDVTKLAAVHNPSGPAMTTMIKAQVIFRGNASQIPGLAGGSRDTVIFDGYLAGTGLRRQENRYQLSVHLVHWLSNLTFASSLSELTHPSNPAQYTFRACTLTMGGGASDVEGSFLANTIGYAIFTTQNVLTDLWGAAMKPYLCQIASFDHLDLRGPIGQQCNIPLDTVSEGLARQALSRIEGAGGSGPNAGCDLKRSSYTPPLSLKMPSTSTGLMVQSIAQAVAQAQVESWAHITLWDKLVGAWGPMFLFSIVPQVSRALVVPFQPGLRSLYSTQILARDYGFADLSSAIPRPIRAMAIMAEREFRASPDYSTASGGGSAPGGIGGCFSPAGARGYIMFKGPPPWLANVPAVASSAAVSSGLSNRASTSSATTPSSAPAPADANQQQQAILDSAAMYNAFAKSMYVTEALRGRRGMISGRARFDIAPGSNVRVEVNPDAFIGREDQFTQDLAATVAFVSIGFNAETASAATSFQLADYRTLTENAQDRSSIDSHPLYDQKFLGAPLL